MATERKTPNRGLKVTGKKDMQIAKVGIPTETRPDYVNGCFHGCATGDALEEARSLTRPAKKFVLA